MLSKYSCRDKVYGPSTELINIICDSYLRESAAARANHQPHILDGSPLAAYIISRDPQKLKFWFGGPPVSWNFVATARDFILYFKKKLL